MTTIGAATKKGRGIYFNPATMELLRVGDAVVGPGPGWKKFSEDLSLGLLASRRELERQDLVADASKVDWSGMSAGNPKDAESLSQSISRFRRASDDATRRAGNTRSFLSRLAERLRYVVEGSSIDGSHGASLAVIPVSTETPKHHGNRSDIGAER